MFTVEEIENTEFFDFFKTSTLILYKIKTKWSFKNPRTPFDQDML